MKKILFILLIAMVASCSKHNNPTPPAQPSPGRATLNVPAQNQPCKTGSFVTDSTSSIFFQWSQSSNTDQYELDIKNLLTGTFISPITTSKTQFSVVLPENTPYEWYVISKSNKTTATTQSATWKFYSAGAGTVTYPPFPADIISPTFGETVPIGGGTVQLSWSGSSVTPATIASYDVYFGNNSSPPKLKSAITSIQLTVNVSSGNTYYWKIVTRDQSGDTSDSGLFQFSVK